MTLEESLGVRLIERGSQTLRLTEEGRALHERTHGLLGEIAEAGEAVVLGASTPKGRLHTHIPRRPDHADSRQPTSDVSSFSSTSIGTFKHRRFRSKISTTAGLGSVVDAWLTPTSSVISTGRNIAGRST